MGIRRKRSDAYEAWKQHIEDVKPGPGNYEERTAKLLAHRLAADDAAPLPPQVRAELLTSGSWTYAEPYAIYRTLRDRLIGSPGWVESRGLLDRLLAFFRTVRAGQLRPVPSADDLEDAFGDDAPVVAALWSAMRFVDAIELVEQEHGICTESLRFRNEAWELFGALRGHWLHPSDHPPRNLAKAAHAFVKNARRLGARAGHWDDDDLLQEVFLALSEMRETVLNNYKPEGESGSATAYVKNTVGRRMRDRVRKEPLGRGPVAPADTRIMGADFADGAIELLAPRGKVSTTNSRSLGEFARLYNFPEPTVRKKLDELVAELGEMPAGYERRPRRPKLTKVWEERLRTRLRMTKRRRHKKMKANRTSRSK